MDKLFSKKGNTTNEEKPLRSSASSKITYTKLTSVDEDSKLQSDTSSDFSFDTGGIPVMPQAFLLLTHLPWNS